MSEITSETEPAVDGYEIVANLLSRQDEVLEELNELNTRIEATIKSINVARQTEAATEQAAAMNQDSPAVTSAQNESAAAKAA